MVTLCLLLLVIFVFHCPGGFYSYLFIACRYIVNHLSLNSHALGSTLPLVVKLASSIKICFKLGKLLRNIKHPRCFYHVVVTRVEIKAPLRLCRRNLKAKQSPAIFDLCLRTFRAGISHYYDHTMMSLFSKIFICKTFTVHTKTQSRRIQIPPI